MKVILEVFVLREKAQLDTTNEVSKHGTFVKINMLILYLYSSKIRNKCLKYYWKQTANYIP
jgi:hypothetical protein